jgi:hypothetical protein
MIYGENLMNRTTAILLFSFLSFLPALGAESKDSGAPIPTQIATAKTAFLSNACALDYNSCRKAYNEIYEGLQKWGKYKLVGTTEDADLVLELHYAPAEAPSAQIPFRIVILDAHNQFKLWTINEPIDYSFTAAKSASTLGDAVQRVLADFKVIAAPGATAGPAQKQ